MTNPAPIATELPLPEDVARKTGEAMSACNYASEQLRGIGSMVVQMAETLDLQCGALADEFARRSNAIAASVQSFADTIYGQARQVQALEQQLVNADPLRPTTGPDAYGLKRLAREDQGQQDE